MSAQPLKDRLPAYSRMAANGDLDAVAERLSASLSECRLCPGECGRNRSAGEVGECGAAERARVSWSTTSVEEFQVTGGTVGVVRAGENGRHCVYCEQLAAQPCAGHVVGNWTSVDELAGIYRMLQDRGCSAIHWVAATPCLPFLVSALAKAMRRSLTVPIGVSTNGYVRAETLAQLSGVVDSYQVELKYAPKSHSELPDYADHARVALCEMYRQVGGEWVQAGDGTLLRGLLVHMRVVPDELSRLRAAFGWLAAAVGRDVAVCLRAAPRLHTLGEVSSHRDSIRPLSEFEWHVAYSSLEEMLPQGRHLYLAPERFADS